MYNLQNEVQRRQGLAQAVALTTTAPTPPAPDELLSRSPGLGDVSARAATFQPPGEMRQMLYRSQASHRFDDAELTELLTTARAYNEQHGLTGLLCYREGSFVQLLEGPSSVVQKLFAKIQRDPRHRQLELIYDAPSTCRWFPDWRMAFIKAEPGEVYWLITYLEARACRLLVPELPEADPQVLKLIEAFSACSPAN